MDFFKAGVYGMASKRSSNGGDTVAGMGGPGSAKGLRALRLALKDTTRAIADMHDLMPTDPELTATVWRISASVQRPSVLVIFGRTNSARVRLLNALLGSRVLDENVPDGMRWVRIQYGAQTQVHLSLGNSEFELVEELECNKTTWDVLPSEDLKRKDQLDLSAVLEIELNNQFLKDGIKIILPPDIPKDPSITTLKKLKLKHSELYSKREVILQSYNHVFLYAIDCIGKNIFEEKFCDKKTSLVNNEDFWSTYNFYYMTQSLKEDGATTCDTLEEDRYIDCKDTFRCEKCVFDVMNCLDLHQIKELNPSAQILFILLSDSQGLDAPSDHHSSALDDSGAFREGETESMEYRSLELPESDQGISCVSRCHKDEMRLYEEQCAFINDLLDQWDIMTPPNNKKQIVKTQCLILDDRHILQNPEQKPSQHTSSSQLFEQTNRTNGKGSKKKENGGGVEKTVRKRSLFLNKIVKFSSDCLQGYKLECSTQLSEVHVKILQQLILASFDLARELQIVPKRIQYVASQEKSLYQALYDKFAQGDKKRELLQLMQDVLLEMKEDINNMDWSVDDVPSHQDKVFLASVSYFNNGPDASVTFKANSPSLRPTQTTSGQLRPKDDSLRPESGVAEMSGHTTTTSVRDEQNSEAEDAMSYLDDGHNFTEYEIIEGAEESGGLWDLSGNTQCSGVTSTLSSHVNMIPVANESTSARTPYATCNTQMSVKQATLDVRNTVLSKLSRKISARLQGFVKCLEDHHFGTLQRCVESLEARVGVSERGRTSTGGAGGAGGGGGARAAVTQLLLAPTRVTLAATQPPTTILDNICHTISELFYRVPWSRPLAAGCCPLSAVWRRHTATLTLRNLTTTQLARSITQQILERLNEAHEKYQSSLSSLEIVLASQLHHTEDVKVAIRRKYAPWFARLCLESTSMCDLLMYGMPELGREIGRGQYGVVFSVRGSWGVRGGGAGGAAAKSLLPVDERHYRCLAMEFFYTRCIPPHPNIVPLLGSIVMQSRSAGGPSVLLLTPRYKRDLHLAVRCGLTPYHRACIAIDVATGLRYLHSLGLVHRDVKLKNVLLRGAGGDEGRGGGGGGAPRAALADFGFCAAATLSCGSVVGTPVHMAPELLQGDCSGTVDVYALGILLWYLCAGTVKIPANFEEFVGKEQLWNNVIKGCRPERLPCFSDTCWELMKSCWQQDPTQRALLGDIQQRLETIRDYTLEDTSTTGRGIRDTSHYTRGGCDDSLNMSGLDSI